jgi:hypothetical protein
MPFTNAEKYKCAERELAMRYRVYERWVDAGKMKRATADREYALMEDIAAQTAAGAHAARREGMNRFGGRLSAPQPRWPPDAPGIATLARPTVPGDDNG